MTKTDTNYYGPGRSFLILFLLFICLQSCRGYKDPITLDQAQSDRLDFVKVTRNNGDEQVFEIIEFSNDTYYGVYTESGEKIRVPLDKDDIQEVRQKNKKSSGFFSIVGILVGAGCVTLIALMFG